MLVFASVDPERERRGPSQPVRVLHHDEPKRRGNVQTRSLSAQRCFYMVCIQKNTFITHMKVMKLMKSTALNNRDTPDETKEVKTSNRNSNIYEIN